ncbi:MAG: membrane protein [Porticoccaceae bacterium]|nr:MAG: membrane protein [Porticoccaceae bacterium]
MDLRERLIRLPRSVKRALLAAADLALLELGLAACLWLHLGWPVAQLVATWLPAFLVLPVAVLLALERLGLYSVVTRYSGTEVAWVLGRGVSVGLLVGLFVFFLVPTEPLLPRGVLLAWWVVAIFALFSLRLLAGHWLHGAPLTASFASRAARRLSGRPVAVYGAGAAGRELVAALNRGGQLAPVAFLDDDAALQGHVVSGLKVYPPAELPRLMEVYPALEVLLALPSAGRRRRQEIIRFLERFDVRVRSVPSLEELAQGRVRVDAIREVDVADILGREAVPPDEALLEGSIRGRSILVTGGGGSIGGELARQVLKYRPTRVVLLDHSEYALYRIHGELVEAGLAGDVQLEFLLGSVLDEAWVHRVMVEHQIQTVYHAAAYKHVPLVEVNAPQGFRNNVRGTLCVARAAIRAGVEQFVLVSTDKAVRPGNLMGVTKRLAELAVLALAREAAFSPTALGLEEHSGAPTVINRTRFTLVRFGNVLDSSGSVIPRFRSQIRRGGPVTVTHPEVTRYFMTIPEAAELVLQANALSRGGDLFVLDMGPPVKIDDLARRLIHLSGLTVRDRDHPDGDIEIVYTGIRPGEKLCEELLVDDAAEPTRHPKIFRAIEEPPRWEELARLLDEIEACLAAGDRAALAARLAHPAIGYRPQGGAHRPPAEVIPVGRRRSKGG